jgi:ABC-type sugar transport system ATPase subunit
MNFLAADVDAAGVRPKGAAAAVSLGRALPPGPATLGIRGEHVRPDPAGALEGTVVMDEYVGSYRNVHVDTPAGRVVFRAGPEQKRAAGSPVRLALDPAHVRVFDPATGRAR